MVLLVILVVLAVYVFFLKDGRPAPAPIDSFLLADPENIENPVFETRISTADFETPITLRPTKGFKVAENKVFVTAEEGYLERLNIDGNPEEEYALLLGSLITTASVDPVNERVAFKNDSGVWRLFSIENNGSQTLSEQITDVAFSPSGAMAGVETEGGINSVVVGPRIIFSSQIPDLEISWVNNNTVALTTKPSGVAPGILYLLNSNTGAITRILGNRYGLTAVVSPDLSWVLFSETDSSGKQMITKYINIASRQEGVIGQSTLAEKCVFSLKENNVVYCATFYDNPRNFVMPDDYYKGVFENKTSGLVRINLETGSASTLRQGMGPDPTDLKLSPDEQTLYFINKTDGFLYRLPIGQNPQPERE